MQDNEQMAIARYTRFNRYMVECEFDGECILNLSLIVLIDTWWNVNVFAGSSCVISRHRFNRYMVECELIHKPHESDVA